MTERCWSHECKILHALVYLWVDVCPNCGRNRKALKSKGEHDGTATGESKQHSLKGSK